MAARKTAPKMVLNIGGKDYEFKPAPTAVLFMSQLRGKSQGITNMDGAKWVLRSLKDEDAEEVLGKLESGDLSWEDFTSKTVNEALELESQRPTS